MGTGYSVHKLNLRGFEIIYAISNDETKKLLPLKKYDIIDNYKFKNGYAINLDWLKKQSNDIEYVVVKTLYSCGENNVYAIIPYASYIMERQNKFKN